MSRRLAVFVFALALLATGCNGSDEETAKTTTTAAPSTTATTAVDVTTIPATIDMVYVQRVFDVLDQVAGEVVKEFVVKRQLTPDMVARLSTVYKPNELDRQVRALNEQVRGDYSVFKNPPGIRRTLVQRLITVRRDCVSVEATFDNSGVLINPPPRSPTYLSLQAANTTVGPSDLNPTPFSILDEDAEPRDSCAGP